MRVGSSRAHDVDEYEYRDEGCELSPSCLNCHLPRCKYDDPWGYRLAMKKDRDRQVVEVREAEGLTVAQAARRFGLSERTVYRILRRYGNNGNGGTESAPAGDRTGPRAVAGVR